MKSSSTVSSRESRAYALLFIIFSVINIFGPDLIDKIWPPKTIELKLEAIVPAAEDTVDELRTSIEISPFDINQVKREQLVAMGLQKKTADTWIKFRKAIGGFEAVEQIRDIYRLREKTLQRIEPFAYVSNTAEMEESETDKESPVEEAAKDTANWEEVHTYNKDSYDSDAVIDTIDLNSATAEELGTLRGIGPVFSARIVKFRNALGGFHSIEQVAETYGLPVETYQAIRDHLKIDATWRKLDINSSEVEQLGTHPYISWELARMIVRYREQNGKFDSVEELLKLHGIKMEDYQKIRPYLKASKEIDQVVIEESGTES